MAVLPFVAQGAAPTLLGEGDRLCAVGWRVNTDSQQHTNQTHKTEDNNRIISRTGSTILYPPTPCPCCQHVRRRAGVWRRKRAALI